MKRYIYDKIVKDLHNKMVFITGPRQVGKTYLSKEIMNEFKKPVYLNYDDIDHFEIIRKRKWELNCDLIVLDEIHKMQSWKNYIKGTFDTKFSYQTFLITGSARLDLFRHSGDSLAGRYFLYHLNPISVKEAAENNINPYEAIEMLNKLGGFPEPFISGSYEYAARWRRVYFDDIIRNDLLDYGKINELKSMKLLLELLRKRVGSPISYNSLAIDLQISPNTIKKYILILENLYIIFLVRPYHKNIARAILKEPKVYFYDTGYADVDEGKKLENTVAVCFLKYIQYMQDTKGSDIELNYIKTKDGKEIDFVIVKDGNISDFIEVKLSEINPSPHIKYFKKRYKVNNYIQLVHNLKDNFEEDGIKVINAGEYLKNLDA